MNLRRITTFTTRSLFVVYLNDFEGQRLLRRSAPRNDTAECHCERSEAISAESQLQETIKSYEMK